MYVAIGIKGAFILVMLLYNVRSGLTVKHNSSTTRMLSIGRTPRARVKLPDSPEYNSKLERLINDDDAEFYDTNANVKINLNYGEKLSDVENDTSDYDENNSKLLLIIKRNGTDVTRPEITTGKTPTEETTELRTTDEVTSEKTSTEETSENKIDEATSNTTILGKPTTDETTEEKTTTEKLQTVTEESIEVTKVGHTVMSTKCTTDSKISIGNYVPKSSEETDQLAQSGSEAKSEADSQDKADNILNFESGVKSDADDGIDSNDQPDNTRSNESGVKSETEDFDQSNQSENSTDIEPEDKSDKEYPDQSHNFLNSESEVKSEDNSDKPDNTKTAQKKSEEVTASEDKESEEDEESSREDQTNSVTPMADTITVAYDRPPSKKSPDYYVDDA